MSFFCSSTPSKASNIVSKVVPRQVLPFLYPAESLQCLNPRSRRGARRQLPLQMISTTTQGLEAWFIKSLASAGQCHKHHPKILHPITFFSSQRPDLSGKRKPAHNVAFRRQQSTRDTDGKAEGSKGGQKLTRQELLDLVDQYDGDTPTDQVPLFEIPNLYQPSNGPHVTVSDKPEDEWPPPHYTWPADAETKIRLAEFESAVDATDLSEDPDDLYQIYRTLPGPRAPYLPAPLRAKFLRHLYTVEQKDEVSMLRYLSVVDDLKNSAIPLNIVEWNSAISFAARYVTRSSEIEVEAALHMFKEMEHVAGIRANGTTFNILFDVASKAGKFTLAEMIYKEMNSRALEHDRYHHVSLIHYQGLQRNGDGARAAYRTLVESCEIVDTVVLNAMISALILSSEPNSAENIYERMKHIHLNRDSDTPLPTRSFLAQREITRVLKRLAKRSKFNKRKRDAFQNKAIVAPDLQTYRILVNYFATKAGDLNKTATLLQEMRWFKVPLHGALFLALFKGFSLHGGIRYTHWSEHRLESVWNAYSFAVKRGEDNLHTSQWMAVWILRAFAKCSGKARTAAVWADIKAQWQPNEMELEFVLTRLRPLMEGPDAAHMKHDWLLGTL
ncbi:Pentatricopeptide repeat-containing protein [Lachnellula suecica]|uniref:Pentatricopeptide repeat-containing protein n=1 Tax=Lachnellula suecica TaxID=602035 RepID=A0A8T9CAX8_9HELO|nr:Pentatricopeptide repeat-containing protein [Lachnellula suecica]